MFIYYINAFLSNRQFMLIMLSANSLVLCATFNMNYPWLRLCIHHFNNSAWTLFIHENILLNFINLITCSGEAIGCTIFTRVKDVFGGGVRKRTYWKKTSGVPDGLVQQRIVLFSTTSVSKLGGGNISAISTSGRKRKCLED